MIVRLEFYVTSQSSMTQPCDADPPQGNITSKKSPQRAAVTPMHTRAPCTIPVDIPAKPQ
jgi:hypothetical protein